MTPADSLYGEIYYEKYFGKKGGYEFDIASVKLQPFLAFIRKTRSIYLSSSEKLRILDVGCAKGFLVKMLKDSGLMESISPDSP